ncbi:transposase [Nonomuraea sp. NPDC049141]|uniref:transposase n=1 Tax=Nonomuraea sp. NPDC049141 TaxID=3155500 RepID=UPI0033C46D39
MLTGRADALFELIDAIMCADHPVTSVVQLSLEPEFRRGHGALYDALAAGSIDADALADLLAEFLPATGPPKTAVPSRRGRRWGGRGEELRTGDIAVVGSNEYADWGANLLPWSECEPLLEGFCEQVGLPSTGAGFVAHLRSNHLVAAAELDAGYEDNTDLVISDDGVPTVKRRRGQQTLTLGFRHEFRRA